MRRILIYLLVGVFVTCTEGVAQEGRNRESRITSALMYYIVSYADWLETSPKSSIPFKTICVSSTVFFFDQIFHELRLKSAKGSPVVVSSYYSPAQLPNCHLLVSSEFSAREIELSKRHHVLTVGVKLVRPVEVGLSVKNYNNRLDIGLNEEALTKSGVRLDEAFKKFTHS